MSATGQQQDCSPAEDSRIAPFLAKLAKSKEDWQVNQAREALRLYHYYLAQEKQAKIPAHSGTDTASAWQTAARQMEEGLRLRHRSIQTEKSYMTWLRSFYSFVHGKSPSAIDSQDVKNSHEPFGCIPQGIGFNTKSGLQRHALWPA